MSKKSQFLTFEIHLTDAALVAQLQANPPGETSMLEPAPGSHYTEHRAIVRAPYNPGPPAGGAAVEFGTADVPVLPMIGPGGAVVAPCLYSEWFISTNNFPRNVATFTRKSGGWFGIPQLFGDTTRFFWRGVFVYTPPLTPDNPDGTPGTREPIAQRNWIDGFFPVYSELHLVDSQGGSAGAMQSRAAASHVDGCGFAMRGVVGVRTHYLTGYTGGGISAQVSSWERLYLRINPSGPPVAPAVFWQAFGNNGAGEIASGVALAMTPGNQIAVYDVSTTGVMTLVGTTSALTPGTIYKLDLIIKFGVGAQFRAFLNGSQAISFTGFPATGLGVVGSRHEKTSLGLVATDATISLDVSFWMNAKAPNLLTGIDFLNGSRAVLVRPNGFGAGHANWAGDFRLLAQHPPLRNITANTLTSTTSGALLAATTDAVAVVDGMPNGLGVAAFMVAMYGHRGTLSGTLGYKIGAAASVMAGITQSAAAAANGTWNSVMYRPNLAVEPLPITPLELHHAKGADVGTGRVVHLSATVELLGTFGAEDFDPTIAGGLTYPLPFLGIHNAPYPRSPWARNASPALAPVVIKSGTFAGNSAGQDLLFRIPVHFLWIRRLSGTPKGVRWWSSRLGAGLGLERATTSSVVPDQLINGNFDTTPAPSDPTGVGALPDRSAQVTAIVAANVGMLDGDEDHRRDLLFVICRELNATNPADGNNWGVLTKNDRTPPFIPSDILVWNPTKVHVDVLTDTGASWTVIGVIPPEWSWTKVAPEGQQEQQTIVRVAGADPECNQTGETYHYVTIGDPARRFTNCEAIAAHPTGISLPKVTSLFPATFSPDAGFFVEDRGGVENDGTDQAKRMAYKGPGNAAAAATLLNGTQITPAVTFAAGQLTLDTGAFSTDGRLAFALFRRDDGSSDPGRRRVVQIVTYVGNGDATRGIALTPPSERRPLWAMFAPNTPGTAYYKDAQHSGGNSTAMDNGSQITTAIKTGDIDLISVGATLNANGTTYNVFVIVGGLTGGSDGFSIDGEFIPVEPDTFDDLPDDPIIPPPGDGDDDEPPIIIPPGDPPGTPCGGLDGMDCDLTIECAPLTTRLANLALSRIGIARQVTTLLNPVGVVAWSAIVTYAIGDRVTLGGVTYQALLASLNQSPPNATYWFPLPPTDPSQEAVVARLHYAQAVESTLRDFPWPFATRYAALTLIAGSTSSPVNSDWTYSYRRPADCVFERRVAIARSGAVDPTPPPFQLSFDDGGGRIFTNQANARLEYTARPPCVAGKGDPLFIDALIWKLASVFAPALSRNTDTIKHAADEYKAAIAKANDVIRPGNPGPRTTVDPAALDTGTGCALANVAIVNRALIRIGAKTIANLDTEQSRESDAARVVFEEELRATLRDFPWAFSTKYQSTLAFVAGTVAVPANGDWTYAYRYPSDCVFVRRIVSDLRRAFDPNPPQFRIGQDTTGGLIFTDTENPTIEYTARIPCAVGRGDALFRDALAWRLAASLAPSLAQVDPAAIEQEGRGPQDRPRERKVTEAQLRERAAKSAWQMYYLVLEKARRADVSEAQPDIEPGDPDWIRGRE